MTILPPEPPLSDGVVTLRPWGAEGDVDALVESCNELEIARYLDLIPSPYTPADAKTYLDACRQGWREGSSSNFAILLDERPVGSIGLRIVDPENGVAEAGYWVRSEARGRGVASRALRLLSAWALRERSIERLQLRAATVNPASQRVAEKAGFTREGVLRSAHYNARLEQRVDWAMYSLLPDELRQS